MLPLAIAADVGGIINTAGNWGNIDNVWEGVAAYAGGATNGVMAATLGPLGAVGGGFIMNSTNNIIAQTGNGVGLGDVDWGQVVLNGGVGAVSSLAGYGAGKLATKHLGNAVLGTLKVKSPVASMAINGTVGGGAGGYAGGFTAGYILSGGDLGFALESGWNGLKSGSITGFGVGTVSGYGYARQQGINPWTGAAKGGKLTVQFGKGANQVSHAFRHTDALGLDRAVVKSAIETHFKGVSYKIVAGKPFNQVIEVAGQRIQYTAFKLKDGTINIGRIHGVK